MSSFRRRTIVIGGLNNSGDGRIPLNLLGEPVIWSCSCHTEYDMKGALSVRCYVCGEWMTPRPLKTLQSFSPEGGRKTTIQTAALRFNINEKTCGPLSRVRSHGSGES